VTEIKICGITNLDDASFAAECGADALGFVFHSGSPRYVEPETAKAIIEKIPDRITKVGVFVNHALLEVKETVEFCGLDLVQLHGDESPEYCRQFSSPVLIKAFSPRRDDDLRALSRYSIRAILVDAFDPTRYGGTGKRSDWRLAAKVKESHLLILAGGLNANNIREAIEIASPHAVDISSGVEGSPGRKNPEKVRTIIEIVHQRDRKERRVFPRRSHTDADAL
jgi:phosphoribosylanthranilate isomerase